MDCSNCKHHHIYWDDMGDGTFANDGCCCMNEDIGWSCQHGNGTRDCPRFEPDDERREE